MTATPGMASEASLARRQFGTATDLFRYGQMWLDGGAAGGHAHPAATWSPRRPRNRRFTTAIVAGSAGGLAPADGGASEEDSARGFGRAGSVTPASPDLARMDPDAGMVVVLLTNRVHPAVSDIYIRRGRAHGAGDGSRPVSDLCMGMISGTSVDGIDVALVEIAGHGRARRSGDRFRDRSLPAAVRGELLALYDDQRAAVARLCSLKRRRRRVLRERGAGGLREVRRRSGRAARDRLARPDGLAPAGRGDFASRRPAAGAVDAPDRRAFRDRRRHRRAGRGRFPRRGHGGRRAGRAAGALPRLGRARRRNPQPLRPEHRRHRQRDPGCPPVAIATPCLPSTPDPATS